MSTFIFLWTGLTLCALGFLLGVLMRRPVPKGMAAVPLSPDAEPVAAPDRWAVECADCGASTDRGWCPEGCGFSLEKFAVARRERGA